VVHTVDGQSVTGLLVERNAAGVTIRDPSRPARLITIASGEIEELAISSRSIMPVGQINQLASRQQFLDLARYVSEIARQGLARARELEPPPTLYAAIPLPEYEQRVDHAGMIAGLDDDSFQRGEIIYNRLCVNCHGTQDRIGSLPTSLRFTAGKFKNGADPYTMYQTLTRGFGLMVAQRWMVPQQKYDVIHYVREAYLKDHNPGEYHPVDERYLAEVPGGDTQGPPPREMEPWVTMDYGPSLINTYEAGDDGTNLSYKGIAVRLDTGPGGVSRGRAWSIFDHDTLRMAVSWTGQGFTDWNGIQFDNSHAAHPRVVGSVAQENLIGPGWGHPQTGSFVDPRLKGRDGRCYGPLPRQWAHYRGLYHHQDRVIVSYTVGRTDVLEMPGMSHSDGQTIFTRSFNIGPRAQEMVLQVCRHPCGNGVLRQSGADRVRVAPSVAGSVNVHGQSEGHLLLVGVRPRPRGFQWHLAEGGNLRLTIPAGRRALRFALWTATVADEEAAEQLLEAPPVDDADLDLQSRLSGGPPRCPERVKTETHVGSAGTGGFAVDVLTRPVNNPWLSRLRFSGLEFYPDGDRALLTTWDGDVWLVSGLAHPGVPLTWQRIASGLFQPLGIKMVDGQFFVTCRDQLVILRDLNGDREIDFYENFNNDHQVTEHFHEFAMGLQSDAQGNFFYAKSARHALPALIPHHGTLLKVSPDGLRTDVVATGFRAANGVCLNPDGSFIVTDQEGHWNPKNRINWVTAGKFYGNMYGYHDVTDSSDEAMEQPLCWITNTFDRSPAELLWVDSPAWGPLQGSLLNLSYGYGKVYVVPHERVAGHIQGGMCELPLPQFPTGIMRGRFHPVDGQLYVCGLFAWSGTQQQPGGFYRIRYTGGPVHVPSGLHARSGGVELTFTGAVDRETAIDASRYFVKIWSLKRTKEYGSDHFDEHTLQVTSVRVTPDARSVFLEIPEIQPTQCMEIRYELKSADGERFSGAIHNTIHRLADP